MSSIASSLGQSQEDDASIDARNDDDHGSESSGGDNHEEDDEEDDDDHFDCFSCPPARAPPPARAVESDDDVAPTTSATKSRALAQRQLKRKLNDDRSASRSDHRTLCLAALDGASTFPKGMRAAFVGEAAREEVERVRDKHVETTAILEDVTTLRSAMDHAARTLNCQRDIQRIASIRALTASNKQEIETALDELESDLNVAVPTLGRMRSVRADLRSQQCATQAQDEVIDTLHARIASMQHELDELRNKARDFTRNLVDYDAVLEHRRGQPNFHHVDLDPKAPHRTFVHAYVDEHPEMLAAIVRFLSSDLLSNQAVAGIFANLQRDRQVMVIRTPEGTQTTAHLPTAIGVPIAMAATTGPSAGPSIVGGDARPSDGPDPKRQRPAFHGTTNIVSIDSESEDESEALEKADKLETMEKFARSEEGGALGNEQGGETDVGAVLMEF